MKFFNYKYLSVLLAFGVLTGCNDSDPAAGGDTTNQREFSIADYLVAGSNSKGADYNVLYEAAEKAGLLTALESGTYTLLAPSDDAFAELGVTDVNDATVAELTEVLNYHLIPSALTSATLTGRITTVGGASISVSSGVINGVANASYQAAFTNGNVFQIDAVLFPPVGDLAAVLADNDELSLAAAAFAKAGVELSGTTNLTLFVPDNTAMTDAGLDQAAIDAATAAELAAIINYHVIVDDLFSNSLDGEYVTALGALTEVPGLTANDEEAGDAEYIDTDIAATNGVIHIVDAVLTPPITIEDAVGPNADVHSGYDFLIFDGLYAGMVSTGLDVTYLSDPSKSYSVYGPCCGAFDASSYATTEELTAAIEAHIFEGVVDWNTEASEGGTKLTSVGGDVYIVTANDAGEFINGTWYNAFGAGSGFATTTYNGVATNVYGGGVLTGLPSETIVELLDADADFTLFSAALAALGVDEGVTVYAVSNTGFIDYYGADYDTPEEIAAEEDAEDVFADILNHVVSGWYFDVDITNPLSNSYETESGNDLDVTTTSEGKMGFLIDPTDLSYIPIVIDTDIAIGADGVVHQVDQIITFD